MLRRYTLPVMAHLWLREETKFEHWLDVELAALRARANMGQLSQEAVDAIKKHATINVERIEKLEEEFDHDMIAFVVSIQESLDAAGAGQHRNEFHRFLTSYDVEDPALCLMLRHAVKYLIYELRGLEDALCEKAREHQWTLMIGRTHGQSAEPTTFGHLLRVYAEAVKRSIARLTDVLELELSTSKMSGAIGTYAGTSPQLEAEALRLLDLHPAVAETQIIQRDRHAALLSTIAIAGGTLEQMCRTFWEMMRSDVRELEEPRREKQRGSSRMSYKKNPILIERSMGMSRLLRACAMAGFENIATPDCRDISQSSVERHIFPDATSILHYLANKLTGMVDRLVVFPERMLTNLERTNGVWAGQLIRDALMEAGVSYDTSYVYVQRLGFKAAESNTHLRELLRSVSVSSVLLHEHEDRRGADIIGHDRLVQFFNPRAYIEPGIRHLFEENA